MFQHGQLLWRQLSRNLHTTCSSWQLNYYDALGIGKRSTQNEIKAAYYKLSMLYHPDKNQGSDSAAKKFRDINQAYEVLGNYRLRRLYDKGIVHTAGAQYAQDIHDAPEPVVEDDPETKFYKSRFQKSKVADSEGRTPIYDFDEWSRNHYGKSFDRRQAAQAKYDRLKTQKENTRVSTQTDVVMLAFIFAGVAIYLMFLSESSYDTPKQRAEERHRRGIEQQQSGLPATTSTTGGKP
ncbi:dnaJ homolog subfamily C member 30, mitochondrial [Drosophila guanche]|uniref:Blast:DnaJ homolog subfamily C member 30 n=1 Tax=Drosophila guanche TaxID=7266 RepID=A0A3B0JMW5_DROGU|nr:dnaJ homolog subfamily C member 30, mitochondrial [Drosophila guanche]SPP83587.1 blast:DnaJ homolog subfamily C member 30 [Drosophila guanche]